MATRKPKAPAKRKARAPNPVENPNSIEVICTLLSQGVPLRQILREQPGMPTVTVFYSRITEKSPLYDAAIAERIACARTQGFDAIADECVRIADTPLEGVETTTDEDGVSEKRGDMLGHRKLQIDTRLKLLAKWDPKRYGDRMQLAGDPEQPLTVTVNRLTPEGSA